MVLVTKEIFKQLKPSEKIIIQALKADSRERFTFRDVEKLTGIHVNNLRAYIKRLAEFDLIDLCDFGYLKEIIKK